MMKRLELRFLNEDGGIVSLTIDDPIEPANPQAINAVMDEILAQNVFVSNGGEFVEKHSARIVERNVQEIEL